MKSDNPAYPPARLVGLASGPAAATAAREDPSRQPRRSLHIVERARRHTDSMLRVLVRLAEGRATDDRSLVVSAIVRANAARTVLAYGWGEPAPQLVPQRLLLEDVGGEAPPEDESSIETMPAIGGAP